MVLVEIHGFRYEFAHGEALPSPAACDLRDAICDALADTTIPDSDGIKWVSIVCDNVCNAVGETQTYLCVLGTTSEEVDAARRILAPFDMPIAYGKITVDLPADWQDEEEVEPT